MKLSRQAMAAKDPEREKRLAEALRENLRRRKAQARAVQEDEAAPASRDDRTGTNR